MERKAPKRSIKKSVCIQEEKGEKVNIKKCDGPLEGRIFCCTPHH